MPCLCRRFCLPSLRPSALSSDRAWRSRPSTDARRGPTCAWVLSRHPDIEGTAAARAGASQVERETIRKEPWIIFIGWAVNVWPEINRCASVSGRHGRPSGHPDIQTSRLCGGVKQCLAVPSDANRQRGELPPGKVRLLETRRPALSARYRKPWSCPARIHRKPAGFPNHPPRVRTSRLCWR